MKKNLLKIDEIFKPKHRLLYFILIIFSTIIITRILVLIKDPFQVIRGFEIHHFYYGIILLIIVVILLLFREKNKDICLILSAIAIGLIADEFIFILGKMPDIEYVSTFSSAIEFGLVIAVLTFLISYFKRK